MAAGVHRAAGFPTTHWSLIRKAGQPQTYESREAFAALSQAYWSPVYAYLRRLGCSADDAQDLVQDFFVHLLEKPVLKGADPERGQFRTLLRLWLTHFVSNDRARCRAKKRGAERLTTLSDAESAENWWRLEPRDDETPDVVYDRRWALTVLEHVTDRLRAEFASTNKIALFDALKLHLTFDGDPSSYAQEAIDLGMSEGAIRVAVYRLRRRYETLLREEVGNTVDKPEDVDGEICYLRAAIRGRGRSSYAGR